MTLNSAYKKIFGEVLEPLGFKCITRQPYFVRVIDGEILHVIALRKEPMMIKGKTDFSILSGVATVYRKKIDFNSSPADNLDWLNPIEDFDKRESKSGGADKCVTSYFRFINDNESSMLEALTMARTAIMKIVLPRLDQISTLDKVIAYLYEFHIPQSIDYGKKGIDVNDFNEGLLQIKIDTADSYFLRREKYILNRLEEMKKMIGNNCGIRVSEEKYKQECLKYASEKANRYEHCNRIFSDTIWLSKVMTVLQEHKTKNVLILKEYGFTL